MGGKWLAAGLLAAVGILSWSGDSRGDDTIRLNMVTNTPTRNLVDDGQGADTVRTWHRGFGWGGGWGGWGYRGLGWGGFGGGGWGYRGLGWGGLGGWGYRGLGWGGFYRPYYGFGLGYGGLGYGGLGYGLGFGRLGYGLGFGGLGYGLGFGGLGYGMGFGGIGYGGFGYGGMFGPCAGVSAGVYTLNMPVATVGSPLPGAVQPGGNALPPQPLPGGDSTFPYDGGPQQVVPNPKDTPSSSPAPRSVPLEGRAVSLPRAKPKWNYPAYGETARRTTSTPERTYLTRGDSRK